MAVITNLSNAPVMIIDNYEFMHTINPGKSLTLPNGDIEYSTLKPKIILGTLRVSGWSSNSSDTNNYQSSDEVTIDTLTPVASFDTAGLKRINVEIKVEGSNLTALQILGRCNPEGTYQLLYSTASDFTSPTGLLIGTSGNLTTQAVGSGYFQMETQGFESIQIKASGPGSRVTALMGGQ